jgi:hypothetical protein
MATSAMDPNRGTAAPYESNTGDWHPGLSALRLIPLFWAPNGTHQKIERWAEHWSWMAAARWVNTTTNRTMVSAVGGGL